MQPVLRSRTALVLCGGGSKGAMEVGLYRALVELRVPIDFVVGTSIGALNGAFIAAGRSPKELEAIWTSLDTRKLFRLNWRQLWKLKGADSLYDNAGIRSFLERELPARCFEELEMPLYVIATRLQTGESLTFERGELITPLLASIALPGVFPPVPDGEHQLVDGGISDNVPLSIARAKGAQRAVFMLCVCCGRQRGRLRGLERILSQSVSIMLDLKYRADRESLRGELQLVDLEPALGLDVPMLDFSRTRELIEGAYAVAMEEIPRRLGA